MSSGKTTNLKMHSWAATDAVLRSEFNDNFNLIDSAVGSVSSTLGGLSSAFGSCEIYAGFYIGTGEQTHSLHFDHLPDIIFIQANGSTAIHSAIVNDDLYMDGSEAASSLSTSGGTITFSNRYSNRDSHNANNVKYYYVAFSSLKQ